jgi:hypothetical protein
MRARHQDRDAGVPCSTHVPRRLPLAGASSFTSFHRAPRRLIVRHPGQSDPPMTIWNSPRAGPRRQLVHTLGEVDVRYD